MKRLEKISSIVPILLRITLNLALIMVGFTLVAFLIREAFTIFNNIFFLDTDIYLLLYDTRYFDVFPLL